MNNIAIVFEGIDGVGKTTQAKILKEKINELSLKSVLLHFPSRGVIGKEIHRMLKSGEFDRLSPRGRALLTASDFFNVFDKLRNFKGVIIFDRYWHSSIASNCDQESITKEWIISIHNDAPIADLVFFLDCDPVKIVKRKKIDFGAKNIQRQLLIRDCYTEIFRDFECVAVDALKNKEIISKEIWNEVQKIFESKNRLPATKR